jgi:tryptophan synthase alpha chain
MGEYEPRGVESIGAAFRAAQAEGRCALITYLTAGYPSAGDSPGLLCALEAGGADVIELGVPYSDPVADGVMIQRAGQVALQGGMTPRGCIDLVACARQDGLRAPVLLMGYYNPIHAYGPEAFVRDCATAGVDGLIVPDLPPEEAGDLDAACARHELALVFLVAPTSDDERIARVAAKTGGFLYVVSRLGTTGVAADAGHSLAGYLDRVRRHARTPVAVGFGLSTPEQMRALAPLADGVIVGSAVVQRAADGPAALREYVTSLRDALWRNGH